MQQPKGMTQKQKEIVLYLVFGVLTTAVNYVVYHLGYSVFKIGNVPSNAIAWVVAVAFAYVTNKLFVFNSRTDTAGALLREMGAFVSARLLSGAFDMALMWLTVDILHQNGMVMKLLISVVVMVINYVFSKLFIFRAKNPDA